jgi:di/tricarboxylate transporter
VAVTPTPGHRVGHGAYRLRDYWGLPLSIIVVVVGVPPIAIFWPFQTR